MLQGSEEVKIPSITVEQIIASLLAIVAFLPMFVCTGYLVAWFTNLHGFRQRSLVERMFWSVPLSLAVSTITAVLIGRFFSLTVVTVLFMASAALWLATLGWEWREIRRTGRKWITGWHPLGGKALMLAIVWIAAVVLSLVDLQSHHELYMSVTIVDYGARVNWIESVLRTGIPPDNPLYWYKHSAPMRNYYFWYVLCAAVAKLSNIAARAALIASCVWAGFALAALNGLYLKHFLNAGARLRKQFLGSVFLFMVAGIDICAILWNLLYLHLPLKADATWSTDSILGWVDTLLYSPNHIAGLVCCMFAFLLAWMARKESGRGRAISVVLMAMALASAFGLSIYVTFAFFLVMLAWALWQVAVERTLQSALLLGAGGAGAAVLLLPYLWELTHASSKMEGGSVFAWAVRQMIAPDGLMASRLFRHLAIGHPLAALNLARLVLLAPGYAIQLGFYFAVLLIYLVPAWRGRTPLTPAQRTLLFIAAATIPLISLVRSEILKTNDFGWRGALLLQFPLLLLGSEVTTSWKIADSKLSVPADYSGLPHNTPQWLRSVAAFALVLGVIGTLYQVLILRFYTSFAGANMHAGQKPTSNNPFHNAYISTYGYAQLDRSIPRNAIVQFNPRSSNLLVSAVDFLGIDHQVAIASDQQGCGSELGGDPSGCPGMAAAIDSLFNGATAEQARTTCHLYNIQYLVARIYDPAWKDKSGWVWTLSPVVAQEEFRALDCRQ